MIGYRSRAIARFAFSASVLSFLIPATGNSAFESCWKNSDAIPTVVMLWSPALPLSLRALAEAEREAKRRGLRFCAAADPGAQRSTVEKVAQQRRILPHAAPAPAVELPDAKMLLHFPSLVLTVGGRIISPVLPGYDSPKVLAKFLDRHLPFGPACKPTHQDPAAVLLSDAPDWLFAIFPSGYYASYSSAEDENFVIHLASRTKIRAPGKADFALSPDAGPDSGIVSVPDESGEVFPGTHVIRPESMRNDHMAFYRLADILACKPKVIFQDKQLIGNYQVIARLAGDGAKDSVARYRVMAAREGLLMRDYLFSFVKGKPQIRPAGPLRKLCPGQELRLPKLSPNGRELAAFDVGTGRTKIFAVADDGKCRETHDLGSATGKVDFDPGSKRIAYHTVASVADCASGDQNCVNRLPEGAFGADVFVLNRTTGAKARLTSNRGASSMFPRFTRDGRLAVQTIPHDPKQALKYELLTPEQLP